MTDAAPPFPGNIEASFARMEGKIDRLVDKLDRASEETLRIRDRVHEIANEITPLVVLGIPGKLTDFGARISSLEADRERRTGAMVVVKGLWAAIGFIGAGGVFGLIKLLGGI